MKLIFNGAKMFFSFLKVHIFSFVLRPIFVLFYVLNVMFFYICNVICGTILFLMFNLILSVCTIPGNMWILFDLKFPLRNDACVAHHDKNFVITMLSLISKNFYVMQSYFHSEKIIESNSTFLVSLENKTLAFIIFHKTAESN